MSRHSLVTVTLLSLVTLLAATGCAKKQLKNDGALSGVQDAALKGEDLALEDTNLNFAEPTDTATFTEVYFDYNSSDIGSAAKDVLAGISRWLGSHSAKHLLIEGHCDERGTKEFNLALGEQRALAVRRYLAGLGIEPKRLHTISYGEERPSVHGHSEAAWAKNRRAHFLISE